MVAVVAGVVGVLRGHAGLRPSSPMRCPSRRSPARPGPASSASTPFSGWVSSPWPARWVSAWLGKRGRHDVATALAVVVMLGLGSLFLQLEHRVRAGHLLPALRRGTRGQWSTSSA